MVSVPSSEWPHGAGAMADLIRARDWLSTPLGPIGRWPQSLKTAVDLMLASAQPVYVAWGPELISLYNDGYIPIAGAKHPDALGQPYRHMWAEVWDAFRPVVAAVMAGEPHFFEDRPLPLAGRADRPMSWFTFSWTPIRAETGEIGGFFCVATETTDRVRSDQARQASHDAVFAAMDEGYLSADVIVDEQGRAVDIAYVDANPAATRLVGTDLRGRRLREVSADYEEHWYEILGRVATTGVGERLERFAAPEGRWYDFYVFKPEPDDSASRRVAMLFRDVTARRHTDDALRESEERYRSLFETMGQGYVEAEVVRDADGHAVDSRLLELNPAFERLTGLPAGAARGRTNRELFPDIEDWWVRTADRIVRSGRPETVEHEVAELGRTYAVHFYPGSGDRYTALYEDVTERTQAAAILRASGERQAFLLKLSDALRPIAEPLDVAKAASRILGEQLGADRVAYAEFDEDEDTARLLHEHLAAGVVPLPQDHYRWSDFDPVGHARGRLGHSISRSDVQQATDLTPAQKAVFAAVGFGAFINVPLVKSGRLVAFTAVHWAQPREIAPADIALAEETAERTWAAVERARAERALRDSEERLRQFGEASQDVLWIRDAARLQWQYLTPAFEQVYGLNRDAALAGDNLRGWLDLIVPEDRPRALEKIRRVQQGEQVAFEYRIRRPSDGAIRWLRNTDFPIRDDRGP